MISFVIDASIAIKWVVQEDGTSEALALHRSARLAAPDLLAAECANILWKKVRRNELLHEEAFVAARLLQTSRIEFLPTSDLLEAATRMAVALDHPACDCLYLALAERQDCLLVTADEALIRKLAQAGSGGADRAIGLKAAAAERESQ